jgi:hypothetical protein
MGVSSASDTSQTSGSVGLSPQRRPMRTLINGCYKSRSCEYMPSSPAD